MNTQNNSDIEKLLYKLVFQFSIYALGSNKQLDPQLVNINKSLKQGLSYHRLTPEFIALSKTLAHISKQENQSEHATPSSSTQYQRYLIDRLNKLLAETDIPFKFQKQYKLLRLKSEIKPLTEQEYKKVIDLALSLLFSIKDHVALEHDDIEDFFSKFSKQFGMLGDYALDASKSNQTSIENSKNLSDVINVQVDNIKNSSENAEELSSLQKNIAQHIQELSFQFQKHQEKENEQLFEAQKQLKLMSNKLQELETEADSLRSNLKVAHDKALSDALTGLPNRMAYDDRIMIEYNRWRRYKSALSLIVWDIDLFKMINDTYGHKAGDKTLALVAQLLSTNCRETDFIARYGGEEFVMLLPNTTSAQALIVAEKIRPIIANSGFNYHGESIRLTISCGISQFADEDQQENAFERADQALYLSKEQGRNKCSVIDK
jgi:diguanylate cyclase